MLSFVSLAAGLLIWGAHVRMPLRLSRQDLPDGSDGRRRWGLIALPLMLSALLLTLFNAGRAPDAALRLGFTTGFPASPIARWVLILFTATAVADALLLCGWRHLDRIEAGAWRLAGLFGFAGLAAFALLGELLALPGTQGGTPASLLAGMGCRILAALAAAECLLPERPRAALAAGLALLAHPLILSPELRSALFQGGDLLTLGAAGVCFLAARWVPGRLRRPTLAAATLLAALWFARVAQWAEFLPLQSPAAGADLG